MFVMQSGSDRSDQSHSRQQSVEGKSAMALWCSDKEGRKGDG